jgi:hypothetical protein
MFRYQQQLLHTVDGEEVEEEEDDGERSLWHSKLSKGAMVTSSALYVPSVVVVVVLLLLCCLHFDYDQCLLIFDFSMFRCLSI